MRLYYALVQTALIIGLPFVLMFLLGIISEALRDWIKRRREEHDCI